MKGVVLMGGKSTRMGADKAFLIWNDIPLYAFSVQKLLPFCSEVYLSVNTFQKENFTFEYDVIVDASEDDGPIAGIISCQRILKDSLLILGCDMPLISEESINTLVEFHNKGVGCSVYFNLMRHCYEPMLSIWNPAMLEKLGDYFMNGGRSLQRFLIESNVFKIPIQNDANFKNINTEADWRSIL